MKRIILISLSFVFLLSSCTQETSGKLKYVEAFPNLSFTQPVDFQNAGDGSNRLFVLSQPGIIYVFENSHDVSTKKVFLDISGKVLSGGEQGLLGLAFHPNYESNGYFYVDYTTGNPRRTVISRFKVDADDPDKADINSEQVLLEVEQPYSNHNGGQVSFGPDGYLYVTFGDGGAGGDPQGNGQNRSTLLGSIVRIDVNSTSGNLNYSIPPDNPFAGNNSGYREEIYAFGLRNVWRFSFDNATNKLWAADVGQNEWEEIDIIEPGKNYGWNIMEGLHCYSPSSGCDQTGITLPIYEYGHNASGGYSITGGFVYHGTDVPELEGKYVYADFVSGNIWALTYDGNNAVNELLFASGKSVSTFGVDENNELYFASYDGKIYKFEKDNSTSVGSITPSEFKLQQNYPNLLESVRLDGV